ncbi:hypothetical protein Adt_46349 [Abeliophyllum distichum]|uniref:Uncharacterized protein n=1 Tax=Abeliophyllum distichum TaxID=126358 RepID=A0ABD1P0U8_9LAMI
MLDMEEKVLRDLEKFERCAAEKDHEKKKAVAEVQSLLEKAIVASQKKDIEITQLHEEGAESLKAAIKMIKEWLVDDHSEINPDEFDRYIRKRRATYLAAQKAKVTDHGGVGSQPAGSLDK